MNFSLNPKDWARNSVIDDEGRPKENFQKAIEKAIDIQRPFVIKKVRELRAKHPDETPEQFIERLERRYMTAVTAGGAAVGATAFVPGVGTVASLGFSAAATIGFMEASAVFAQAVAEVHGIQLKDPERAKALVMAVMLGEESSAMLAMLGAQATGRGGGTQDYWGKLVGTSGQAGISGQVMASIRRRFFTRFVTRQGAGFIGRTVPFGIGAVIGGAGNRIMGKSIIKAAREAFGPAPETIPGELVPSQDEIEAAAKSEDSADKE
ncbi:hypothetical protein [Falsarthrobacter nasiphocae]|uniref:Di-and tripeptidase n=1 Tax=Falsarthrobacter nasiphocae TaxID=189863 RepID=A0AAE4C5W9_9MICC|nr:hypothetical protein [Falsarthrobacter nasiphocae]MDR6891938.1 hypothetical protein [Falsarthrobacter nasiphocae]